MTKEEIINIAWNIFPISDREKNEAFIELLVHFAQGIAEKEREECAKICDDMDSISDYYTLRVELICAQAIRARGQE
jgi:hypothetical protein